MSEWISVSERLPGYEAPVLLVYHGVVQRTIYSLDIDGWRASDDEGDHMPQSFASHWMPLPEPPHTP